MLLCSVDELFPKRAAESIPVEEGRGDPDDLLASSPRGLESEIENNTVSLTWSSKLYIPSSINTDYIPCSILICTLNCLGVFYPKKYILKPKLTSSPRGLESGIENDTVSSTSSYMQLKNRAPDTGSWKKKN